MRVPVWFVVFIGEPKGPAIFTILDSLNSWLTREFPFLRVDERSVPFEKATLYMLGAQIEPVVN